ncbi:hypothetical protein GCM10027605_24310 [Micromonospora zhanjiangensis]
MGSLGVLTVTRLFASRDSDVKAMGGVVRRHDINGNPASYADRLPEPEPRLG